MADKDKKEKQDQAQGILETETLNRIFDTESISEDFSAQDEGSNVEAEQTNPQETGSANQPEGGETGLIPVESISKDSSAQNEGSNGAAEQPTSQETDSANQSEGGEKGEIPVKESISEKKPEEQLEAIDGEVEVNEPTPLQIEAPSPEVVKARLTQEAATKIINTLKNQKTTNGKSSVYSYMTNLELRQITRELLEKRPKYVKAGVDSNEVAELVVASRSPEISRKALGKYFANVTDKRGLAIGLTGRLEDLIKIAKSVDHSEEEATAIYEEREKEISSLSRRRVAKMTLGLNRLSGMNADDAKAPLIKTQLLNLIVDEAKDGGRLEATNKELNDRINKQAAEIVALQERNNNLAADNKTLSAVNFSLNTQNEDLNAQNKDLNTQNEDLNAQNKDLNTQNKNLKEKLAKFKAKVKKGLLIAIPAAAVVAGLIFYGELTRAGQRVVYVEKDKDPGSSEVKPDNPNNPGEEDSSKLVDITLGAVSADQSAQIAKKLGVAGSVVFNQAKSLVRGEDGKYYVTLLTTNNELYLASLYSSAENTTKNVDTMIAQLSGQSEKFIPLTALNITETAQTKFTQIMELKADKAGTVYTKEPTVKAGDTVRGSMSAALLANDGSVCVADDVIKVRVIKSAESMASNKENVLKLIQWELDSTNKDNYPGNMKYSVSIDGKNGYSAESRTYENVAQWQNDLDKKADAILAAIDAGDYDYNPDVTVESGAKNDFKQNNSRLAPKAGAKNDITSLQRKFNHSKDGIYR